MMNQEIKQKWIEALRSGEYKQTTGTLKHGDAYCCLGVLCEIHPEVKLVETTEHWKAEYGSEINAGILPEKLAHDLGLPGKSVEIPFHYAEENLTNQELESLSEGNELYLTNLNDCEVPFSVIADIIEKEF